MSELAWFLVPTGSLLWMMGGSGFPPFGKGWRRYDYPVMLLSLLWTGLPLWRVGSVAFLTSFTTHLGYGEHSDHWERTVTGLAYGGSVIPMAIPDWRVAFIAWIILAGLFVFLLDLTRKHNNFPHKVFELLIGGIHAGTVVGLASWRLLT